MALTLRSINEEAAPSPVQDLEKQLALAANFTRKHVIASIYHAGSGHPGGALSCADLLACLFGAELNFWPNAVDDPHRDRFVLKGAMLVTTWLPNPHRSTRDVDLLGYGDPDPERRWQHRKN